MRTKIKGLISGFIGAITLTGIHQLLRTKVKDAPRIDKLGVQAIEGFFEKFNIEKPSEKVLYNLSIAGDLLFNTFYYSSVATGKKPLVKGALLGTSAGSSVITLPGPLNLNENFSAKNFRQGALSFAIYLIGGLAAAGAFKLMAKV